MTIRRHVDLAALNSDYTAFLSATEQAAVAENDPHPTAVKIMEIIGDALDGIMRDARSYGIQVCNGDGLREIEALIFGMMRDKNPEPITAILREFGDKEHIEAESVTSIEALPPADPDKPSIKDDDEYLAAGTGDLWEVRVTNSLDDIDHCDFHVRAETPGEAADKAEIVARRNSDFYFGNDATPSYYAERRNITRIDEEDEEPDLDDDADRFSGYEDAQ